MIVTEAEKKAKELVERFYRCVQHLKISGYERKKIAKEDALICVEEMIYEYIKNYPYKTDLFELAKQTQGYHYLEQVKQAIEEL